MTTPPFDAIELVAFMPTPFGDGGIDEYAVEQQMEHYRDTGVTVGLLGGLGEFYAVSHDEATQLMRASVEGIGGEGKVLAAVGFATREAVRLAESAARVGCRGLVVNPPYYVHPSPQLSPNISGPSPRHPAWTQSCTAARTLPSMIPTSMHSLTWTDSAGSRTSSLLRTSSHTE